MKANQIATPPTSQVEPDFVAAMSPKKSGRPRKIAPAPAGPAPSINNISISNIDNIDIDLIPINDCDIKALSHVDMKGKLTTQELTFLEIFFNSPRIKGKNRVTIEKAMIAAGYTDYGKNWRYILAKKIMGKYAQSTPGAAKIFQDLGFGQVRVALGIIDKAENAKSEAVSLNALALAARCQGMTEPTEAGRSTGVQIIINTGPAAAPDPAAPGAPPALVINADGSTAAPAAHRRALQITR